MTLWQRFINWLNNQIFMQPPTGPNTQPDPINTPKAGPPTTPQVSPTKPRESLLDAFCSAIEAREGANPANRNPGNCKYYYGGYLPIYGSVKRSAGGFAVFPTYDLGMLYLHNLVKSIIKAHPTLTFFTFFAGDGTWAGYSPKNDGNDPISYAQQVATKVGLPVNSLVDQILK